MTGLRTSCVFKPEKTFCVEDTSASWNRLPSGLNVKHQPKNNLRVYNEIGNKFIDNVTAGMFSGTFSLSFKLDYQCIGILGAVFEDYLYNTSDGTHRYRKLNGKRPKSMTLRFTKLNRYVGGSKDEVITCLGCVATSFNLNQSGSDATIGITISGIYADEYSTYPELDSTDWEGLYSEEGDVVPVEWTCVQVNDSPVAYTSSATFGVSNGIQMVPGCGTRYYKNYSEGNADISMSTSCWSVHPEIYYQRMYSGGVDNTHTRPMAKGLKPIPKVSYKSFYDENEDAENDYYFTLNAYKVWVDSPGDQSYQSGSQITDSPSFKVTNFDIVFKNTSGRITIWD